VTTTASNVRVTDTRQAAFFGAHTGFGQKFGSSRYQSDLTIGLAPRVPPASHGADSVTTVIPPAARWLGLRRRRHRRRSGLARRERPGGALAAADLNPQDTGGTPILN